MSNPPCATSPTMLFRGPCHLHKKQIVDRSADCANHRMRPIFLPSTNRRPTHRTPRGDQASGFRTSEAQTENCLPPNSFGLPPKPPFVAHFYPWEAKTKAEKKLRRRPNQSPNRSPAKSAKSSPQPRRSSAATAARSLSGASPNAERPSLSSEGLSAFGVRKDFGCKIELLHPSTGNPGVFAILFDKSVFQKSLSQCWPSSLRGQVPTFSFPFSAPLKS